MVAPNAGAAKLKSRPEMLNLLAHLPSDTPVSVIVFGSVARQEESPTSDFDVLIVTPDDDSQKSVRRRLSDEEPTITVLSRLGLLDESQARPSFVAHLVAEGVAIEGEQAWREMLPRLRQVVGDRAALERELKSRSDVLDDFSNIDRFEASPYTFLSHLYAIARSAIIARLLLDGVQEFSWTRIFDRFSELRPELTAEIDEVRALRPYYEFVRARSDSEPTDPDLSPQRLQELFNAVEAVVRQ